MSKLPVSSGLIGLLLALLLLPAQLAAQGNDLKQELDTAFLQGLERKKMGRSAEAVPFFEKAAALAPKVFGADHLNTAAINRTLGLTYLEAGRFNDAETALRRCLAIRETQLAKDHMDMAFSLGDLGHLYSELSRFKEAEVLLQRSLAIQQIKQGKDHFELHTPLNNLAVLYYRMGKLLEAEAYFQRCLQLQEGRLGANDPKVALTANNLGNVYQAMGRLTEAETLLRRALKIWEAGLGPNDLQTAYAHNGLGVLCQDLGLFEEAGNHLRRSLQIRESKLGKDHPMVATSVANLGILHLKLGQYQEAEPLFRRSMLINETTLGKDHLNVANDLENLGGLYQEIGRFEESEALFRRSLAIREAKLGKDHAEMTNTLNYLAAYYNLIGRQDEAETLYKRCIRIAEKERGKDHPDVAAYLGNLAVLFQHKNQPADALPLLEKALGIIEGRYGKNHPRTMPILHNLGANSARLGKWDEAEQYFGRSLQISEKVHGPNHSSGLVTMVSLAGLYMARERPSQALQLHEKSLQIHQTKVQDVFSFSSESAMDAYLQTRQDLLPILVSMAAQSDSSGPAVETALNWLLRMKGIVLDTQCRYRQAQALIGPNDQLRQRLAQYRSLKHRLADAPLKPMVGVSPEKVQEQLEEWRRQAEKLEEELTRGLAQLQPDGYRPNAAITCAEVRKQLPPKSALIEFYQSPQRDFAKGRWLEPHYFAFVLTADAKPPRLIDLGPADNIADGVETLRKEFADFQDKLRDCETVADVQTLEKTQEKRFRQVAVALHTRLIVPLVNVIGPVETLYLAPDAHLNRLPFEALVSDDDQYLVETYRCAYLSSGRDLVRPALTPAKGTVVFAGPDYKLDAASRLKTAQKYANKKGTGGARGQAGQLPRGAMPTALRGHVFQTPGQSSKDLRSIGWTPLPGAKAEAADIQQHMQTGRYGPVRTFVGGEAVEEALKNLTPPRILHLATHGFFLDHQPEGLGPSDEGAGAGWARGRLKRVDNPLLRSGIVLAGANTIGDEETLTAVEDGWVTAEEIALLNLRGTELVVLSACQTGLGDVKTGEGVYGLRRAFMYAGARTLMTSLFEVPDRETRELMQRFYRGLQAGQGKLAALNAAQRDLLRQRRQAHGAAHPFFWASFVLVGDPG